MDSIIKHIFYNSCVLANLYLNIKFMVEYNKLSALSFKNTYNEIKNFFIVNVFDLCGCEFQKCNTIIYEAFFLNSCKL